MDDAEVIYNLWRIRRTVLQMCHDRGYLVGQDELDQSFEQFQDIYGDKPSEQKPARSHLDLLVAHNDDPTNTLHIRFADEEKLSVNQVKGYCQRMEDENMTGTIVIVQKGVTAPAGHLIRDELEKHKFRLEVFLDSDLLVNITQHTLVPKHVILTAEERQELLQRYRLKETQLPRIQSGDPVARYFGLTRGQVVRITRTSETAGRYITYRLVT